MKISEKAEQLDEEKEAFDDAEKGKLAGETEKSKTPDKKPITAETETKNEDAENKEEKKSNGAHTPVWISLQKTQCGWYIDSLKISNLVLVKISEFWIHVCVKKKKESVQKKFPFFSLSVIQNQYSGLKTHKILLLPQFQSFFLVSHEEKCNWSSK